MRGRVIMVKEGVYGEGEGGGGRRRKRRRMKMI